MALLDFKLQKLEDSFLVVALTVLVHDQLRCLPFFKSVKLHVHIAEELTAAGLERPVELNLEEVLVLSVDQI